MQISYQKVQRMMADQALTQRGLAERMGVSSATVSAFLRSAKAGGEFQPATVGRYAAALKVSVDDLIIK